jgi:hypothetical protein
MKFLKWTALAVCTAAAFAVGAAGAGIAHFYLTYRYEQAELDANEVADTSLRVELLTVLRDGRRDEAKVILEEKLDRDILQVSGMLDEDFSAIGQMIVESKMVEDKWFPRENGPRSLREAARHRRDHPWECGNPETDRRVRETLSKALEAER